jgi:hypothetical protein
MLSDISKLHKRSMINKTGTQAWITTARFVVDLSTSLGFYSFRRSGIPIEKCPFKSVVVFICPNVFFIV